MVTLAGTDGTRALSGRGGPSVIRDLGQPNVAQPESIGVHRQRGAVAGQPDKLVPS